MNRSARLRRSQSCTTPAGGDDASAQPEGEGDRPTSTYAQLGAGAVTLRAPLPTSPQRRRAYSLGHHRGTTVRV